MANDTFPKIGSATWWTLREHFQRTIPTSVTKSYLATVLGVADRTAANVVPELRRLKLIDDDGKPTDLANRWRFDKDYPDVCDEIRAEIYPSELSEAIPDPKASQERLVEWFQRRLSVGVAAARRMTVTYSLLTEQDLSAAQKPTTNTNKGSSRKSKPKKTKIKRSAGEVSESKPSEPSEPAEPKPSKSAAVEWSNHGPSLHIDLQIHISPESSLEQIDKIFASMKKHLYSQMN